MNYKKISCNYHQFFYYLDFELVCKSNSQKQKIVNKKFILNILINKSAEIFIKSSFNKNDLILTF